MSLSCKGIHHRSDVLVGDVLQVEGQVGWASDGEVGPDVAAVLRKRRDEKTNRPRGQMALASPFAPACSTTWRAWLHVRSNAACCNGSQEAKLFVSCNGSFEDLNGPRMLSENSPGQCNASEQDLASWFQGESGGSVESHNVGRIGTVGANRFGDGSGKLGKGALSRWRSFDSIKPSGKDERVNDLDLVLPRPRPMTESVAKLNCFGQALVDSGATKA